MVTGPFTVFSIKDTERVVNGEENKHNCTVVVKSPNSTSSPVACKQLSTMRQ